MSDDKDAVVRELKTCSQLVKDALEEIEEVGTGSVVGTLNCLTLFIMFIISKAATTSQDRPEVK